MEQRTLIAELSNTADEMNSAQTALDLTMTGVDILPYVEAPGGYEVITEATGSPPPDDVYFEGTAVYKVSLGLQ